MSISSVSSALNGQLFNTGSGASNWLANTITNIQNEANQGGLLGMLANSNGDGSISTFLGNSANTANAFAQISQTSLTSTSSLIAQQAAQNQQQAQAKKLQDAFNALQATQQQVQPQNTLDPYIYLSDGSSIDTTNNIMTTANGTQYDITTGAKYVDPASIIQMANGAYLDTKNNILTESDGTAVDINTGLKISVTA
jgi:hypothetical protein